jgi:hypothetical protein
MTNQDEEISDYWTAEDFEDTVARMLIACFESKVIKAKGAPPSDRLNDQRLAAIRALGPYVPSESRVIVADDWGNEMLPRFDTTNDHLPDVACLGLRNDKEGGYMSAAYVRKAAALGQYWQRRAGGVLYEMVWTHAKAEGIYGERVFFSVTKAGQVVPCTRRVVQGDPRRGAEVIEDDAHLLAEWGFRASATLQYAADRRFCWTITAKEKVAKAHLGCMQEEVKSLLYARSLPMTETGRKRPILHLVEAHKRRMRNGTEIDVSAFLRGTQTVEIGGTVFTVNAPKAIRPQLSERSQRLYMEEAEGHPA